jgi:DNA-binding GntR family transcriptional regulator
LIEGFSAREAAGRLSSKEIIQLKSLIHKMETHMKREEGDKYIRVAEQFHDLVNCAAGNKVTYGIYQKLSKQTLWHRINFLSFPGRLKRSFSEHKEILDALIQGNQDLAESLMKEHIGYSKKVLLERLNENAKDQTKGRGEI